MLKSFNVFFLLLYVTQQIQIPLSYVDAMIGTVGSNIIYYCRASGAIITVQETRGVRGEMTVEIHGTATQVQMTKQLIQVSISDFYVFSEIWTN